MVKWQLFIDHTAVNCLFCRFFILINGPRSGPFSYLHSGTIYDVG